MVRIIKQKKVALALAIGQALISSLSSNHPIKVNLYLVQAARDHFLENSLSPNDLKRFLLTESQYDRYEKDLLEDAKEMRSEKAFVIVQTRAGVLEQHDVNTMNQSLPDWISLRVQKIFDRKNFPWLGEYVDLWCAGNRIVASGHYHAFGEKPSRGDLAVARASQRYEIVVTNGLVPQVFLDGKPINLELGVPLPAGEEDAYVVMSSYGLLPPNDDGKTLLFEDRLPYILNYLAVLKLKYGTDPLNLEDVKKGTIRLHQDFRSRYGGLFDDPRSPNNTENAYLFVRRQNLPLVWVNGDADESRGRFNSDIVRQKLKDYAADYLIDREDRDR